MSHQEKVAAKRPADGSGLALLGIYLNDHLAGATFGTELSARVAASHRDSAENGTFDRLATEIGEDRAALIELMKTLNLPVRQYKAMLGWIAEKAGRFKPNGHVLDRSPLSSLEELEMMRLGVEGKLACWRTLGVLADRDTRLDRTRLRTLQDRAEKQIKSLEELRQRVTTELADAL
jgi:hypothetical protein